MSTSQAKGQASVTVRPGVAERLAQMIQLPTVSAERETRGLAPFDAFIALIEQQFPLVHAHLERERHTDVGLLFRWKGKDAAAAPVVLMAHFDVVPVDESDAWTHPPFEGRVEDGWVYGRGALDDKGPLVIILEAVENLLADGFTPARDVYLSFGGDEESFGSAAKVTAESLRDRGIVPWLVIDEGGAVVDSPLPNVGGEVAMVGVGEKGILTLRLSARGDGGHASAPPARTAVGRIARAVDRLSPSTFAPHTPQAITGMIRRLAEQAPGASGVLYKVLAALPPVTARAFALMGGESAALVRTTIAPTMQSGGTAPNVLPSQASATLNLRVALGETVEGTVNRVRRRISDPLVQIEVVDASDPSPESRTDNAQFALIAEALEASHPGAPAVPYIMMQASDSRHYHAFSPAVYRFSPLRMSTAQRAAIHGVDERVEIAELERGERFHRRLLERLQ